MSATTSAVVALADRAWTPVCVGTQAEHVEAALTENEAAKIYVAALSDLSSETDLAAVRVEHEPLRIIIFRWAKTNRESDVWQALHAALHQQVAA